MYKNKETEADMPFSYLGDYVTFLSNEDNICFDVFHKDQERVDIFVLTSSTRTKNEWTVELPHGGRCPPSSSNRRGGYRRCNGEEFEGSYE
ncbi:uncharacterized protein [Primulina huaijiensis]|uniref:uncharacterized protein n=1 Tax=Primulina huaijiensis TaxID=1492673 RepID=UPI003CC71167